MNNTILYALTVLIWGSTWYAITFQLGNVHPILSVSYRFTLASCLLFVFLTFFKKDRTLRFSVKQHITIAMQGFYLFCLNYILFYYGTVFFTSGLVAITFSTITFMNILNQSLFFGIGVQRQVVAGSAVGLIGIIMVFWPEVQSTALSNATVLGMMFCLFATYSASIGNMVSIKNSRENIPVLEANTFGMMYGAVFSFILALAMGIPLTYEMTYEYTLSLLYLALFGSAIAFGCYLTLMKNIGADKAAYASVLFPIVALAVSTIFEGYIWTSLSIIGVCLTLLGNIIAVLDRERMLHWRKNKS